MLNVQGGQREALLRFWGKEGLQRGKAPADLCVQTLGESVLSGRTHLKGHHSPKMCSSGAEVPLCRERLLPTTAPPTPVPERCTVLAPAPGLGQVRAGSAPLTPCAPVLDVVFHLPAGRPTSDKSLWVARTCSLP